jgi:tetratricopeptide (TPR) repeat protein
MIRVTAIAAALAVGASYVASGVSQATAVPGLTGAPQLARAYNGVLDARFDEVPRLIQQACPPAPAEACVLLDTIALWWQIQLDPMNKSRDEAFVAKADAAVAAAEAWTVREPMRAEAWFYLGGAYGARVQWRSLRRHVLSAARDGKRIKASLERALELDPAMHDAYFGIGLYHYYADVAPTALKMLRWLLLLPGGDREQGLQEMLRARNRGELARSEADYQLHLLYLWYEKEPQRALEILHELRQRHPHNPHFLQLIAELHDVYLSDPAASARAWEVLLDEARRKTVAMPAMADATARLGLARQLDRLGRRDEAIAHLQTVIAARPSAPFGAVERASAHLRALRP